MKSFVLKVAKTSFVVLMYSFTIILAFVSACFSIMFYIEGQTDEKMLIIGVLAGIFELVKVSLAITYPAMQGRDRKIEKSVKKMLYFALFMSIMASLYFFMMEGEKISISPATKVVNLVFENVAILNTLPKTFIIFVANMSLSIMVEVLIIKLPSYALIFFKEVKEHEEKQIMKTSTEKLMLIPKYMFNKLVNKLVNKCIPGEMIERIENPKIKIVEELETPLMIDNDKGTENKNEKLQDAEVEDNENFFHDRDPEVEKEQLNRKKNDSCDLESGLITEIEEKENTENKHVDNSDLPQDRVIEFLNLIITTAKKIDGCEDMKILSEKDLMLEGYSRDEIENFKDKLKLKDYIYVKGRRTYLKTSKIKEFLEVKV